MKKLIIFSFCILAMLVSGCGSSKDADTNKADNTKVAKLNVGLMPDLDAIPFIVAQHNGYFKEEGVEVELHPFKSAMDRDAAFQSGNLDGTVSDMLAVAFAKKGGFDLKITSSTNGDYRLVASQANKATNIKDMQGQEIAVSKNTIIEFVLDQILENSKLDDNYVKKVVIPQIPTRLEMLQQNKLAGAVLPDPLASIAIAKGAHQISSSQELHIQPGVIVFSDKAIKENPEAIKRMYKAYNRAVEYINNTDKSEYIDYVIKDAGFPPIAKTALTIPKYKKAELPQEEDWTRVIDWLNAKGLVKEHYGYKDVVSDIVQP